MRRALSIAINREALADRVMEGTAKPAGQWLPEGVFGYNPEVRVPPFDADGAKRMLAEAGFPQGFRMTITTPNDRYPNDARTAQAVAQMWTRIGVRTEVDALPWAAYSARSARQEFNMRLVGWGSSTGEASYMLVNIFGTYDREKRWGAANNSRVSDRELDALTERAASILDDEKREAAQREAVKMAMDRTLGDPALPARQRLGAAEGPDLRRAHGRAHGGDGGAAGAVAPAARHSSVAGATGRIALSFTVERATSVSTRCTPGSARSSSLRKASSAGRPATRSLSR